MERANIIMGCLFNLTLPQIILRKDILCTCACVGVVCVCHCELGFTKELECCWRSHERLTKVLGKGVNF